MLRLSDYESCNYAAEPGSKLGPPLFTRSPSWWQQCWGTLQPHLHLAHNMHSRPSRSPFRSTFPRTAVCVVTAVSRAIYGAAPLPTVLLRPSSCYPNDEAPSDEIAHSPKMLAMLQVALMAQRYWNIGRLSKTSGGRCRYWLLSRAHPSEGDEQECGMRG